MKVLLIHQNFLGQYKHLGPALVRSGNQVFALTLKFKKRMNRHDIDVFPFKINGQGSKDILLFWLIHRQIFWAQKAVITLRWTCSTKVSCRMLFWRIMAGAN